MRVFYDANALLSIFLWPGFTKTVHEQLVRRRAVLITSERVLAEVLDVTTRRHLDLNPAACKRIEKEIRTLWQVVSSTSASPSVALRDATDDGVLADAEHARATVLMTGDRDLVEVADQITTLVVLTPRQVFEAYLR